MHTINKLEEYWIKDETKKRYTFDDSLTRQLLEEQRKFYWKNQLFFSSGGAVKDPRVHY